MTTSPAKAGGFFKKLALTAIAALVKKKLFWRTSLALGLVGIGLFIRAILLF